MNTCRLCAGLSSEHPAEIWNKPLLRSENFVVLPSLGALVEGWLLIVPAQHFLCLGTLPQSMITELQRVKDQVCSMLLHRYGKACAFEHGPSKANTRVGCGVDHAHLHVVPVDIDLISAVTPFLPAGVVWTQGRPEQCLEAAQRGNDYLYLEQPIGRGQIALHDQFGSQLFRRAIAEHLGTKDFNWREHPRLDEVAATIDAVRLALPTSLNHVRWSELAA